MSNTVISSVPSAGGSGPRIPCCVVDNHCDVVPFLQAAWKAKCLPDHGLSLVHFDAHPDLVPPPLRTADLTDNRLLLDRLLDSEGGISEFILPLVLNGHVSQGVYWVKPAWSTQIPCGRYIFHVGDAPPSPGADTGPLLGVSAPLPYYMDDGLVYADDELSNATTVSLSVSEAAITEGGVHSGPYVLDICLDYFYTVNPFVNDLKNIFEEHAPGSGESLLAHYSNIFSSLRYRGTSDAGLPCRERREMRSRFLRFFEDCVFKYCAQPLAETTPHNNFLLTDCDGNEHSYEGRHTLNAVFLSYLVSSQNGIPVKESVEALLDFVVGITRAAALPSLLTQKRVLVDTGCLVLLPDSGGGAVPDMTHLKSSIRASVVEMMQFMQSQWCLSENPPLAVCIARSDGDGYTSPDLAALIQAEVITAVSAAIEACPGDRALAVYDIRDEPVLQSRRVFIRDAALFAPANASSARSMSRKRRLLQESGYDVGETLDKQA